MCTHELVELENLCNGADPSYSIEWDDDTRDSGVLTFTGNGDPQHHPFVKVGIIDYLVVQRSVNGKPVDPLTGLEIPVCYEGLARSLVDKSTATTL